jgi:hypothetical protein
MNTPHHEQVSRVDLFADIAWSKRFYPGDAERFVTRAKSKLVYYDGSNVSGFVFGKGKIMARVYNKALEAHKLGKIWFFDLWGVDENGQVWRVEFQLRREALKELTIETFGDLMNSLQALWDYCAGKWLYARKPGTKRLIRFWETAQAAKFQSGENPAKLVKREKMRSGMTEKQIFDQMAGLTKCYARVRGIENHSHALDILIPRIRERVL